MDLSVATIASLQFWQQNLHVAKIIVGVILSDHLTTAHPEGPILIVIKGHGVHLVILIFSLRMSFSSYSRPLHL